VISPYVARLRSVVGHDALLLPSVCVLPRDAAGRLLLVRHVERGTWGCIGGMVEPGESPAEAARREAFEEAGVRVALGPILAAVGGPRYEVTYLNGDHACYVAVAYAATISSGDPRPDHVETSEVGWFAADQLAALEKNRFLTGLLVELGELPDE
jgi:ADP-ribose pyrophosphatase YjhB (NUDIX family)